jgi:hypothetical protein
MLLVYINSVSKTTPFTHQFIFARQKYASHTIGCWEQYRIAKPRLDLSSVNGTIPPVMAAWYILVPKISTEHKKHF